MWTGQGQEPGRGQETGRGQGPGLQDLQANRANENGGVCHYLTRFEDVEPCSCRLTLTLVAPYFDIRNKTWIKKAQLSWILLLRTRTF